MMDTVVYLVGANDSKPKTAATRRKRNLKHRVGRRVAVGAGAGDVGVEVFALNCSMEGDGLSDGGQGYD